MQIVNDIHSVSSEGETIDILRLGIYASKSRERLRNFNKECEEVENFRLLCDVQGFRGMWKRTFKCSMTRAK